MHTQHPSQGVEEFTAERGRLASQGMLKRIQEGWFAGPAPLGYVNVWRDGVSWIERDESLVSLIQQAFYLIVCTDVSLRRIHREMMRRGLRNKKGKELSFSAFQLMVMNPFYCGKLRYQGDIYEGKHQAMISEELFEMVQKKLGQ